jgi:hypothetical protein
MKRHISILRVLLTSIALTAAAETRFVMVTGFAGSTDQSEATAKAVDDAETKLDNECDGGRLSNIHTSVSCDRSGSAQFGYTYYCTATKSAQLTPNRRFFLPPNTPLAKLNTVRKSVQAARHHKRAFLLLARGSARRATSPRPTPNTDR